MHLSAELDRLAGSLLCAFDARVLLHVAQQGLDVLLEHGDGALAQLKGPIVLLKLREDGAVLKLQLDEDSCQFEESFLLGRLSNDFLELLLDPFAKFVALGQFASVVVAAR